MDSKGVQLTVGSMPIIGDQLLQMDQELQEIAQTAQAAEAARLPFLAAQDRRIWDLEHRVMAMEDRLEQLTSDLQILQQSWPVRLARWWARLLARLR